jgi:L-asparagine transporter-like permease
MSTIATEEGLRRRLRPRQIAMMAIGSAIGVGLFLGSTVTIRLAGPAVILTYVIGAVIALVMGYALAEMAVVHPVAGSFGVFADRYLSPWFGFAVRATYAFVQILAIGAEVTAVAIYFAFWFPQVPPAVWIVASPRRSSRSTPRRSGCSAKSSTGLRSSRCSRSWRSSPPDCA